MLVEVIELDPDSVGLVAVLARPAHDAPDDLKRLLGTGNVELQMNLGADGVGVSVSTKSPPSLMFRANSEKSSSTVW